MSSRRRLNRKMQHKELLEKLRVRCPVCRKVGASSEAEAWELARKQFARFGGEMPKRVYQCRSGQFHWTRADARPQPVGIPEIAAEADIYSEEYWK
jgi:hypothetical protein